MNKEKSKIIITSKSIISDSIFKLELRNKFALIFCPDMSNLLKLINNNKIDLLLIEIYSSGKELKIIKSIHERLPELPIIAIGIDKPMENLVQAFQYEIIDFFRIPYNRNLLIERIKVISKSHIKN